MICCERIFQYSIVTIIATRVTKRIYYFGSFTENSYSEFEIIIIFVIRFRVIERLIEGMQRLG